ncbi:MAG: NRDE family protein [Gammaproteobacteria bacterium]
MCLIVFAHRAHPDYPLVLAANRDEFFQRPTRQAHLWQDREGSDRFIAGKDLQAGGTWLGAAFDGRFAMVTNIRDPSQTENKPRSRGELPLQFLQGSSSPEEYAQALSPKLVEYAGFNLLIGDLENIFYINNSERTSRRLEPGIYGLSNGLLDAPWPKIEKTRTGLERLLAAEQRPEVDSLIELMNDRQLANDDALPDTGLPRALERQLSSPFISNTSRNYGTLCSTAVIVEKNGRLHFREQNYDSAGNPSSGHYFRAG